MCNRIFSRRMMFLCVNLITLTQCIIQQKFTKLFGNINIEVKKQSIRVYPLVHSENLVHCTQHCMSLKDCSLFTYSNGKCAVYHDWKDKLIVVNSNVSNTFYREDQGWYKVFVMKKDARIYVVNSYMQEQIRSLNIDDDECKTQTCDKFHRSSLLDLWKKLPITQVKVVLRKGKNDTTITFNGLNTNKENWFDKSRVVQSPWSDIKQSNMFSITGYGPRKFYISSKNVSCQGFGWLAVVTVHETQCSWYKTNKFPQIYYSTKKTYTNWQSGEYESADWFMIFIRFT